MSSSDMLPRWLAVHARGAACITIGVAAAGALLPAPSAAQQLGLLAGLVAVLGLPHGAVDHWQGRELLRPRVGGWWPAAFGVGYSVVSIGVIAAWLAWPPLLLGSFLLLAALHFGHEDATAAPLAPREPHGIARAELVLRGMLPIALPVLFHPEQTAVLFAALLPQTSPASVTVVLAAAAPLAPAYGIALVCLAALAVVTGRRQGAVELAVLVGAFATLPPLLGFALYFCFWHAPRHTLAVIALHAPRGLPEGIRTFTRAALPLTALTLGLGGSAWLYLQPLAGGSQALLQVLFIGLAALTVPHVLLPLLSPPSVAPKR